MNNYYSKVNIVSLMGVSNSENMLLSEKDLNAVEFNFLVNNNNNNNNNNNIKQTTTSESQDSEVSRTTSINTTTTTTTTSSGQDRDRLEEDRFEMLVSTLKLKIPKGIENSDHDHDRDRGGFTTPTSSENRIPAVLECPPAPPRKPKSPAESNAVTMKRKSTARRRVFLNVAAEIESLFPPAFLADLIGGKIKKFRRH